MSTHHGLQAWHAYIDGQGSVEDLAALLAEDAVFHSPVVHTPQVGRAKVIAYLAAAAQVLGGEKFRYVRELVDGENAMLEFETEIDGVLVNGIDLIRYDETGLIKDFKVMVRPLKAINKVWEVMAAQLERASAS